jgi:ankyrin repeat protein
MDEYQGEHRFQAAQARFKTLLPFLIELDQLTRDHAGLLMTPLEDMGEEEDEDFATPIHFLCKYLSSPHLIQSFIDMCPDALNEGDEIGYRPLYVLCSRDDVPLQTVEALAEKNPEAFQIPDEGGWVPLHAAAEESSLQAVSFVATRFPDTAKMKTNDGFTPLHLHCERNTPAIDEVVELLVNAFPRAAIIANDNGDTPLHLACNGGASDRVIRLLLERGPRAVEMLDNQGATVLHCACFEGASITSILLLLNQWHFASILLASVWSRGNHESRTKMLPHDCAVDRDGAEVDVIAQSTKDTACALIEYSLSARTSMPATLTDHVRNFVTALNIPGFNASASGVALRQTLSPHLTPDLVHNLVDNDALQQQLKNDKDLQSLIGGLVRMNKSGRNYVQAESSNAMKGLAVLNSVSNNVDCFFIHLRENVSLMRNRKKPPTGTAGKPGSRKRKAHVEPEQ